MALPPLASKISTFAEVLIAIAREEADFAVEDEELVIQDAIAGMLSVSFPVVPRDAELAAREAAVGIAQEAKSAIAQTADNMAILRAFISLSLNSP
jgi:hypothetical protein